MAFINGLNRLEARAGSVSPMTPVRAAMGGV
jgi:hypothetical protein